MQEQERTSRFFSQEVTDLSLDLEGRIIALYGTNRQLKVISTESWLQSKVGEKMSWLYAPIRKILPGDLWTPRIPVRRMQQSLVGAQDSGNIGACVRLLRATYLNTVINDFSEEVENFKQREGDIARYFGLEEGSRSKLMFLDETEILYLVPNYYPKDIENSVSHLRSQEADAYLRDLLKD